MSPQPGECDRHRDQNHRGQQPREVRVERVELLSLRDDNERKLAAAREEHGEAERLALGYIGDERRGTKDGHEFQEFVAEVAHLLGSGSSTCSQRPKKFSN